MGASCVAPLALFRLASKSLRNGPLSVKWALSNVSTTATDFLSLAALSALSRKATSSPSNERSAMEHANRRVYFQSPLTAVDSHCTCGGDHR